MSLVACRLYVKHKASWLAHLCVVALHALTNAVQGVTALLPSTQNSTCFSMLLSNRYMPLPFLH